MIRLAKIGLGRPACAPLDYGVRRPSHRVRHLTIWMTIAGLVLLVGVYTPTEIRARRAAIKKATAWRSYGPPCPTAPPDGWAPRPPAKAFRMNGVVFARAAGHVSCGVVHTHGGRGLGLYPACKFITPGTVAVRSKTAAAVFYPGLGRSVTVTLEQRGAEALQRRFFW